MGDETENSGMMDAVDVVDVDSVKKERKGLTKGPVASVLLLLLGLAGLIGIGGFWAYPQYKELRDTNYELGNLDEAIAENKKELRRIQKENEDRPPSEKELAYAKVIPTEFNVPQSIRDILQLALLDSTNPDDDLRLANFSFAAPKSMGEYSIIETNLSFTSTNDSLYSLMQRIVDPKLGLRLATPTSLSIKYEVIKALDTQGSPAEQRLSYLLRQNYYHLITAEELAELIRVKAVRIAEYNDALIEQEKAIANLRLAESKKSEGVDLLFNTEELKLARDQVRITNDKVKRLEKTAENSLNEIQVNMKIDLYVESSEQESAESTSSPEDPVKKKKA